MSAAMSLIAVMGGLQSGHNGCRIYWAKVRAVMAFPVGMMTNRATHRYRNAGSGPNASLM